MPIRCRVISTKYPKQSPEKQRASTTLFADGIRKVAIRGIVQALPVLALLAYSTSLALSQETGNATQPNPPAQVEQVVVTTSEQNSISSEISPELGVNSYTADQAQIASVPGGDSAPFQQVLLRLPGVVQDSYGEVHVRGEHGYTGYRINGVTLPEGLEGFGQQFDSHFIQSATLLTGALPAQFGLRVYGVVDISTKTGSDLNGGEVGVYGGSFDTIRPYLDYGGSNDKVDYFFSFSELHSDLGIENPTDSTRALHDYTDQLKFSALLVTRLTKPTS